VVGIKIDRPRNRLLIATWEPGFDTAASTGRRVTHTRLFAYDLTSGKKLGQWAPRDSLTDHLLNDLVVTSAGDVYITDTYQSLVYRLRGGSDSLELFARPDSLRFSFSNGIALSADERSLYVAFVQGIGIVDIASRRTRMLPLPSTVTAAGIDGLYRYGQSLIAVQTFPTVQRVVRFDLDVTGTRITGERVLERGTPYFDHPTTGSLAGDDFYYVPNSQYQRQDATGKVTSGPDAKPSVVIRLRLR